MRLIKAKDAAQKLGVDVQTIRNWGEKGIIDIIKKPHVHYVNEEQIDALFPELTSTEESKRLLAEEKAKYESMIKKYKKIEEELHEEYRVGKLINFSMKKAAIHKFFDVVINLLVLCRCLTSREAAILTAVINGKTSKEISKMFGVTPQNVSFMCQKAIRHASDIRNIEDRISHNEELEEKVSVLENSLKAIEVKAVAESAKTLLVSRDKDADALFAICNLLNTKIGNLDVTVRTMNALKCADIETLGDLVRLTRKEVRELRHLGYRCLSELEDLVKGYNLSWGMDVDSYYAAFGTLIKD